MLSQPASQIISAKPICISKELKATNRIKNFELYKEANKATRKSIVEFFNKPIV